MKIDKMIITNNTKRRLKIIIRTIHEANLCELENTIIDDKTLLSELIINIYEEEKEDD